LLKTAAKYVGFIVRVATYIASSWIARCFMGDTNAWRRLALRLSASVSTRGLRGLDVRCTSIGMDRLPASDKPHFFVANHLADLDVMVLQALVPSVFITSVEVQASFFVGAIAKMGGAYFVERRERFGVRDELKRLQEIIAQGFDVVLFAEGTSTNGESVLPFKNTLMQSAIDAEAVLVPVCLNYMSIDGQPVTPENRDRLFYYGGMGFFSHLWRLCRNQSIEVECEFLESIPLIAADSRKEICEKAYQAITARYHPVSTVPRD
jgi:lyso-ornithine lipid O-acyltransferase